MRLKEKHLVLFFLSLSLILFSYLIIYSEAAYGGSDNYSHYRISHFSWKYPRLFLDHWGKPLFTILSSPFSQLGFKGLMFFNAITAILTSVFSYLIVKKIGFKNAWFIIPFVLFTPIYFILIVSGLTEILFGFVLVLSIYFFISERYIASAIVISFIIFSRTEGFVLYPLFIFAFVLKGRYKVLPLMCTGFLIFSILGFFVLDDFWWFFTKNPYSGGARIYGSGDLMHFLNKTKSINGIPLAIIFVFGLIDYLNEIFRLKKIEQSLLIELALILFTYLVYLFAHSFVWAKGIGGSAGLIRVMAAVMPVAAIVSLRGFNFIIRLLKFNQFAQYGLALLFAILLIKLPFQLYNIPVKRDAREKVIHEAANWLQSSKLYNNKIYYYDTYFCYELDIDPYNQQRCIERIPSYKNPGKDMPIGSVVEWDAHFAPTSGYLPLDSLILNKKFVLLASFKPEKPFSNYAGYNFEVHLFQKVKD